ncbi:cilia and flagella associated protein 410 isoform X2 [Latimeria chalumnae]|uniref:cilia and flagella associated protein 410 isoform X2 n=1 Tax=Latimeria chalumnae TaxID=7897 RepID=UPI0003C187BA|nr:PREDICTED: protein C21orf2 isoform X2 [Latimeria chalumnae]|eukprot:XP_005999160.1 PREDICTED: protein C21orf2 isoform X2 [Latimeria chalumnae]
MKLTKKVVLARAKASDLDSIKKLNCCVNNISSLEDFSHCQNLTELYLRKNSIRKLEELHHLKPLPRLRVLWLAENPCCGQDPQKYRMTVLRNLPHLQKLDNQAVTEDELSQALEEGEEITVPPANERGANGTTDFHSDQHFTESAAETESDPLNFSMEETNKIREQLGMKLLSREKFPFTSSKDGMSKKSSVLKAILLLLNELDIEGLEVVHKSTENRLRTLQIQEIQQDR